ncbi:MAG: 2-isopropylmalate synthase [Gallionellaceae bacterium]
MLQQAATQYRPFPPVNLIDRQWPNRTLTAPPIWMSTDLRDGNQALIEPMDLERKMRMFRMLCDIGFKEIEVAFPSASQTDFDFVRSLIQDNHIPADVTIEVLSHARESLIRRSVESLRGARSAILHVVSPISQPFRDIVFGKTKAEVLEIAVSAARLVKQLTAEHPETKWTFEYSPETFSAAELDYSLEVCDAVTEAWGATPENKIIINLPSSVEMATPNVYADQIEWMHRHLQRRDSIILSIHNHNDRGTAVAAAELALLAGADRVEGCLFGNGERTGNVDIVTLALNLHTQGIAPGLDFSSINAVARTVEYCNQLPIHPRHPYVGDLVFTAFSGSHQDAIKKGLAAKKSDAIWNVPYLPINPTDLGRSYDSVIRVNSQSGKGGIAYLLETEYGIVMPRRLQVEFSRHVQQHMDKHGGELSATDIWQLFSQVYFDSIEPLRYIEHHLFEQGKEQGISLTIEKNGTVHKLDGVGNGPIDAAVHAMHSLDFRLDVRSYEERSIGASQQGAEAKACAFMEVARQGDANECYGVAVDANIVTASIKALIGAANQLWKNE